jgi:hypothetical protein
MDTLQRTLSVINLKNSAGRPNIVEKTYAI